MSGSKNKMSWQVYLPVNTHFLSLFPSKQLGPAVGQLRIRYFLWHSGISAPPPTALHLSEDRKKTFAEVFPNKEEVLSLFPPDLVGCPLQYYYCTRVFPFTLCLPACVTAGPDVQSCLCVLWPDTALHTDELINQVASILFILTCKSSMKSSMIFVCTLHHPQSQPGLPCLELLIKG